MTKQQPTSGAPGAAQRQLRLIEGAGTTPPNRLDERRPWRLDAETVEIGRRGVAAARAALLDLDPDHEAA